MIRRAVSAVIVAAMFIHTALFQMAPASAVEFGWQPLPEGGIEYLIQVEPQLIDSFRDHGYTSDLPTGLRDIRRVRVVVGKEKLPNQGNLAGPPPALISPTGPQLLDPKKTFQSDNPVPPAASPDREPHKFTPDPAAKTVPAANLAETTPIPTIKPGEGPTADSGIQDTVGKPNSAPPSGEAAVPTKPWGLLMLLLFALFLSLGANTYLVWIHQALRSRYRSLVGRPAPPVSA